MKWILFFLSSLPVFAIAQDSVFSKQITGKTGILFEQGLSWEDVKLKAKAEGKPIFMDCYATWCGPCKFMSQHIFTQKAVGDFMNENFINVAVQMDRTAKDGKEIKKWYADATTFGLSFSISEYPTYLFFGPDGRPLHRIVGSTGNDPKNFIVKAKEALDPDKQYYTQIEKYKFHLHDSGFLRKELIAALKSGDSKNSECLANAYFDCIQDPYNVESINLIRGVMQSSRNSAFPFFLNHSVWIDSAFDEQGLAERTVGHIIASEEVIPLFEKSGSIVNWSKIKAAIKQKYPAGNAGVFQTIYKVYEIEVVNKELKEPLYSDTGSKPNWNRIAGHIREMCPGYHPDSIIAMEKPRFYAERKMWSLSDRATLTCLKRYGDKLHAYDLNGILWEFVFMHSNNRKLLTIGVEMARRMVPDRSDTAAFKKDGEVYNYMDTYANLLYKIGMKNQAILWEVAALSAFQNNGRTIKSVETNLKITISKMEKGESTWVGRVGAREEFR